MNKRCTSKNLDIIQEVAIWLRSNKRDLIYSQMSCKSSCEKLWVHQTCSWKLAVSERESGLSSQPANATPASTITHNQCFTSGSALLLIYGSLEDSKLIKIKLQVCCYLGLQNQGLIGVSSGTLPQLLPSCISGSSGSQKKICLTEATVLATVLGILGPWSGLCGHAKTPIFFILSPQKEHTKLDVNVYLKTSNVHKEKKKNN